VIPVFLDTVGLLAIWDEDDQWHGAATSAFDQLKRSRRGLITTTYVLAECANSTARTAFRLEVDVLRERLELAGGLILPGAEDWSAAWLAYRRGEAGAAGLVDHLSFAVMRRLGLTDAFTNDRHFASAGFHILFWPGSTSSCGVVIFAG
jgi:uncharacterized protein